MNGEGDADAVGERCEKEKMEATNGGGENVGEGEGDNTGTGSDGGDEKVGDGTDSDDGGTSGTEDEGGSGNNDEGEDDGGDAIGTAGDGIGCGDGTVGEDEIDGAGDADRGHLSHPGWKLSITATNAPQLAGTAVTSGSGLQSSASQKAA